MKMVSSSNPEARRGGARTPGGDRAVVLGDCQKITSRPRAGGNTNLARVFLGVAGNHEGGGDVALRHGDSPGGAGTRGGPARAHPGSPDTGPRHWVTSR